MKPRSNREETAAQSRASRWPWAVAAFCAAHTLASWLAMGGWHGIAGPWPLAIHDHANHEHNAWVTRPMLLHTGWMAGYDPYFMSGYAKSLLSSPSSTLAVMTALVTGGASPAIVYKVTVFLALASLPWLVAAAGSLLRLGGGAVASAVAIFVIYTWTGGGRAGFPLNYAYFGMTAFLLAVPLGLVATAAVVRFLHSGGRLRWLAAAVLESIGLLVHVTSVLFLAPAALLAYAMACRYGRRFSPKSHVAVAGIGIAALVLNAFWLLPALWLRQTQSGLGWLFIHPEPVWRRILGIVVDDPPIQAVIWGLALPGLVHLWRRDRIAAAGLAGFAASGFFFGYLAGGLRSLDFLEPGRQTYALHAAASVLAGVGLAQIGSLLYHASSRTVAFAALIGLAVLSGRLFGTDLVRTSRARLGLLPGPGSRPSLGSDPPPAFRTVRSWVEKTMKPGERLFYEEGGITLPDDPSPFGEGRYSGLLPQLTGVEVVGGFYLHVGLATNFTQIGEGKLFGKRGWDREHFVKYAKIYRPTAIICWSRDAVRFCVANPDLIEIRLRQGKLLAGRVKGFEGAAVRGRADVQPEPGRLKVTGLRGDLDGAVVLRYHHAPGLRCRPPMRMERVFLEEDPVPFIGLWPGPGQTEAILDLKLPPGR